MKDDEYLVILTPRTFQMAYPDWHIKVVTPRGDELWSSASRKWLAKRKAKRMIRRHKAGKYKDPRTSETFRV